ncbi:hypothetical protein AAVH_13035 [Aphelenchoides avenae]|nr:hypothetical protein AAVH_13035 [Aphelenchus avenae]
MLDLMNYTISPELLPPPEWAMTLILLALILRFLKIFSYPEKPQVTVAEKGTSKGGELKNVLSGCPLLEEKYSPPLVWGRCGHLQTAVYGVLGHASLRRTYDRRCFVKLPDGTTVSYDIFEPIKAQCNGQDKTL